MTDNSRYQAAHYVAQSIEDHFAQYIDAAVYAGEDNVAEKPSSTIIETIINAAFWASLRREEGNAPKISIAYMPPEQGFQPMVFQQSIPLSSHALTKLSPGVERPGVHLGVWKYGDKLCIWGTTLRIPNYCFVLDVSEPGLLVVKFRRSHQFGKFANVAVLRGDETKVIDEAATTRTELPEVLRYLLEIAPGNTDKNPMNVLVQMAVSMRAHKHGGTLLIVPATSEVWQGSIIHPIKYAVTPVYSGIKVLLSESLQERSNAGWQASMKTELESIAGLTAVDGATIINNRFELLAFGAKIMKTKGSERVEKIIVTEPIVNNHPQITDPAINGGTRHLSAAQFVHDQQNALALVASQDGNFTIFSWSQTKQMVHAHRIDALLL